MRYLFILNPAAGKQDCTVQLIPQLQQAAVRAGIPVDAVATCKTEYAGHAKALARAAAEEAAKAGEQLHIWTAGGDGTLVEALTGVQGFANAAVGCLPYGSGNDFLRTYGTREEFTDLDAQLAGGEVVELAGVFIALGVAGSTALARKIGAAVENDRIVTDEKMQTTVPGLYAAGDCTGGLLQVAKAVYEGALAGTEAAKALRKR